MSEQMQPVLSLISEAFWTEVQTNMGSVVIVIRFTITNLSTLTERAWPILRLLKLFPSNDYKFVIANLMTTTTQPVVVTVPPWESPTGQPQYRLQQKRQRDQVQETRQGSVSDEKIASQVFGQQDSLRTLLEFPFLLCIASNRRHLSSFHPEGKSHPSGK